MRRPMPVHRDGFIGAYLSERRSSSSRWLDSEEASIHVPSPSKEPQDYAGVWREGTMWSRNEGTPESCPEPGSV
jgi:hypothetical protein